MCYAYVNNDKIAINDFINMLINKSNNIDEVWIIDDIKDYPCMSLLINNCDIVIHFFENNTDTGSISLNLRNQLSNEYIKFNDIQLEKKFVINKIDAIDCIQYFALTGNKPANIMWLEL